MDRVKKKCDNYLIYFCCFFVINERDICDKNKFVHVKNDYLSNRIKPLKTKLPPKSSKT